jgi:hypothetical protein
MNNIERSNNEVKVSGDFRDGDLPKLLAFIHHAVENAKYSELVLDFSACERTFPTPMVGLCSQALAYQDSGITFSLKLPEKKNLNSLFNNTGWAYLIDPLRNDQPTARSYKNLPTTRYQTSGEQGAVVNEMIDTMYGAVGDLDREDFNAVEWSINEITDNVLNHSNSRIGGLVHVFTQANNKRLQFIVADAGRGIPATLRDYYPQIPDDIDALQNAIKEGYTSKPDDNQGNGLYGSYRVCSVSGGSFRILSGHAVLTHYYEPRQETPVTRFSNSSIPFSGTLVSAEIDYSVPNLVATALNFGGQVHYPVGRVELHYELEEKDEYRFIISEETRSCGNRGSGEFVRNKLLNLSRTEQNPRIIIDLRDIPIISSSFADEAFAKLFLEVGPLRFTQVFQMINMESTVEQLINRAITQRMEAGNRTR